MNTTKPEKFKAYLNELLVTYSNLSILLKEKLMAVDNFDIEKLEAIMKEEQKCVLITKGFDSSIAHFKRELGFRADTLREVILELPPEMQLGFNEIYISLKALVLECKELNAKCQSLTKTKLHYINKKIRESSGAGTDYSHARMGENKLTGMLSKAI